MAIKKELVNKIIVKNKINLIDYSYFLTLIIEDINRQLYKPVT